jgi:hypothetical protein
VYDKLQSRLQENKKDFLIYWWIDPSTKSMKSKGKSMGSDCWRIIISSNFFFNPDGIVLSNIIFGKSLLTTFIALL